MYVRVRACSAGRVFTARPRLGPGSFYEVRKLLPLLTESSPDHPSFHVVALSLPGYGFSEAPRKQGFVGKQYAEVYFHTCMRRFDLS
jgi:hypothetical protein